MKIHETIKQLAWGIYILAFLAFCDSPSEVPENTDNSVVNRDQLLTELTFQFNEYERISEINYDSSRILFDDLLDAIKTVPDTTFKKLGPLLANISISQNNYNHLPLADSLMKVAEQLIRENNEPHELSLVYLNKGLIANRKNELDSAEIFFREAILHGKNSELTTNEVPAMINLADLLLDKESTDKAMNILREAMDLSVRYGLHQNFADAANNLGIAYERRGNFAHAMRHYQMSIDTLEKINSRSNYMKAVNNLANVHLALGNDSLAIINYRKVEKHALETNNRYLHAIACINIGNIYMEHEDLNMASVYTEKAIKILADIKNNYLKSVAYLNMGLILDKKGKPEKAIPYLEQSYAFGKADEAYDVLMETGYHLANSLFDSGDTKEALKQIQTAYNIASKNYALDFLPRITFLMAQIYDQLGMTVQANTFYKLNYQYTNTYQDTINSQQLRSFSYRYELQQKEVENRLLTEQAEFDKTLINSQTQSLRRKDHIIVLSVLASLSFLIILALIYLRANTVGKMNKLLTERNKANVVRNQLLEKQNQYKARVFSIISHDIKSPLINLHNMLELLSLDVLDENKRKQLVHDNSLLLDDTLNMIENLLFWTKQQLENEPLKQEPFSVKEIVDEVIRINNNRIEEVQLDIENTVDSEIKALGDKTVCDIILRNLLTNAIKFTPTGGAIHITNEIKDDKIILCVEDTGIGIKEEDHKNIFNEESEFSQPGVRREKGHGLGLILCKYFAEKNGGQIWFTSEYGKGSSFCFSLKKYT